MCPEWAQDFSAFLAYMGPCPQHGTIERINNDGNYEPGNCRWATRREQAQNQRKTIRVSIAGGSQVSLKEFARLQGLPYLRIYKRVKRGMTPEQAAY